MAANKSSKAIPIFAAALIAAALLIYYLFFHQKENDWDSKNYQYNSKEPYGVSIFYDFLKNSKKDEQLELIEKSISKVFDNKKDTLSNYIYIHSYANFTKKELNDLLEYVNRGNTALLVINELDVDLAKTLTGEKHIIKIIDPKVDEEDESDEDEYDEETYDEYSTDSSGLVIETTEATISEEIKYTKAKFGVIKFSEIEFLKDNPHVFFDKLKFDTVDTYWDFLNEEEPAIFDYKVLATINDDHVGMIEVTSGKGKFLIHFNPIAFGNYHVLRKDGKTHLAKVLSHLNPGKVYWDNFSQNFRYDFSDMGYSSDTPLSYILSKPSLAWAFYILLASALLFVIFNAKRIQQSIPLIAPKVNSSLEYIRSVGRLYYQHRKNQDLIERMMQQFYSDVYMRYKIQERNKDNFIKKLSIRSGVAPELIEGILNYYDSIEAAIMAPDEKILTQFYQKIQAFNEKRK
jgi:hypothetical protein